MAELLSHRLFALLLREVERLEAGAMDEHTAREAPGPSAGVGGTESRPALKGRATGRTAATGRPAPVGAKPAAARGSFKERADALILLTRTLEKLLELRSLEARAGEGDEVETLRLREAFMRRLRALDARRAGGPKLFGDEAGTEATSAPAAQARRRQAGPKRSAKARPKAGKTNDARGADGA
ncbi:MAG: hypothetical protein CMP81_09970 [Fulvimarina sp.]|nr:hypothetical protein [Fulvimarina sp.]